MSTSHDNDNDNDYVEPMMLPVEECGHRWMVFVYPNPELLRRNRPISVETFIGCQAAGDFMDLAQDFMPNMKVEVVKLHEEAA